METVSEAEAGVTIDVVSIGAIVDAVFVEEVGATTNVVLTGA